MDIYKPHGNYKPKIYTRYTHTHTRESNPNITKKIVIKSQRKRAKEEAGEGGLKNNQKTINKIVSKYMPNNNYFKYKWTKCSNRKT